MGTAKARAGVSATAIFSKVESTPLCSNGRFSLVLDAKNVKKFVIISSELLKFVKKTTISKLISISRLVFVVLEIGAGTSRIVKVDKIIKFKSLTQLKLISYDIIIN